MRLRSCVRWQDRSCEARERAGQRDLSVLGGDWATHGNDAARGDVAALGEELSASFLVLSAEALDVTPVMTVDTARERDWQGQRTIAKLGPIAAPQSLPISDSQDSLATSKI